MHRYKNTKYKSIKVQNHNERAGLFMAMCDQSNVHRSLKVKHIRLFSTASTQSSHSDRRKQIWEKHQLWCELRLRHLFFLFKRT